MNRIRRSHGIYPRHRGPAVSALRPDLEERVTRLRARNRKVRVLGHPTPATRACVLRLAGAGVLALGFARRGEPAIILLRKGAQ
jgi:hypothetical protein